MRINPSGMTHKQTEANWPEKEWGGGGEYNQLVIKLSSSLFTIANLLLSFFLFDQAKGSDLNR